MGVSSAGQLLAAALGLAFAVQAGAASLDPVSRTAQALPNDAANAGSDASRQSLSGDGCRAVFSSGATNLVAGQVDLNGSEDVFLRDCSDGSVTLLSHRHDAASTAAAGASGQPAISRDGRYVAFTSTAADLVAGLQRNHSGYDLYLYDSQDGSLQLVNASPSDPQATTEFGAGSPVFSADGVYMLFGSAATDVLPDIGDDNNGADFFLYHLDSGTKTLVTRRASGSGFCIQTACTANAGSGQAAISSDGGHVAFASAATNLVAGQVDMPGTNDVFIWDRSTGTTTLASHVAGAPAQAAGERSENPAISADGAFVAYSSHSTALVAGQVDSNGDSDVFLFERATGANTLVSHLPGSPLETDADGFSGNPVLDADGSHVAFTSVSTVMVAGQVDFSPLGHDLFLFERATGSNLLVTHAAGSPLSAGNGSATGSVFSDDGNHLVFVSRAGDLVAGQVDGNDLGDFLMGEDVFRYTLGDGSTRLLSHVPAQAVHAGRFMSFTASTSADATRVLFVSDSDDLSASDDGNDQRDIYLWSEQGDEVVLVSAHAPGMDPVGMIGASDAVVSADGRFVAFVSEARNVFPGLLDDDSDNTSRGRDDDIFLLDRDSGEYVLVSRNAVSPDATGENDSVQPRISGDGRYVVFASASVDVVPGQTDGNGAHDIFLFDRTDRSVVLLSHAAGSATQAAAGASSVPRISRDGAWVVFASSAPDLVAGGTDSNGASDVFLYDIAGASLRLVSRSSASATTAGNGDARAPSISADGRFVAYQSTATDHVSGVIDINGGNDVFLFDRDVGGNPNRLVSREGSGGSFAGNGASRLPQVSADGGFVAFLSGADNLLPGFFNDGNGGDDVFLFDRSALFAPTQLVSRQAGEDAFSGDGPSGDFSISDDGQRVAFLSTATNLVMPQFDGPFTSDLFVFDAGEQSMRMLSESVFSPGVAVGAERALLSGDGTAVLFDSRSWELAEGLTDSTTESKTWLHLVDAGASVLLSRSVLGPGAPPESYSQLGDISPDGSVSLFLSPSPDIVPFDGNGAYPGSSGIDAFVFERALGIPVVAGPPDQVLQEDQGTGVLAVTVGDPDGPATQLLLSARSSDHVLVPPGNIVLGGSGEARTVEIQPGAEQNGSATVTLRATDADGNVGIAVVQVVVSALNDIPQLFLPGPTLVLEGSDSGLLDFSIEDPDHDEADLLLAVASSDPSLLPASGIALAGSGQARRIRITPAADAFGDVLVTVSAEDPDGAVGSAQFAVTVENVNDAPGFTSGGDVEVDEDAATVLLGWAGDIDPGPFEDAQALAFEVIGNSNPGLFSVAPTVTADGTLSFEPAADASGVATLDVRLRDDGGIANGGEDTSATSVFDIAVVAVNDPPVISGAASFALVEDGSGSYDFTVEDVEDEAGTLQVAASPSDLALLPPGSLVTGGAGAARTLSITPAADAFGTVFIEATVTDSEGASSVHVVEVEVTQVDESVDLVATVDNGVDYIDVDASVTWIGSIANAGVDTAYAAQVLDSAPLGLVDATWTCAGFDGGWCASPSGVGPVAVMVQLPSGAYALIEVAGTVTAQAAPGIVYGIEAAVGPDSIDVDTANNLALDADAVGERIFSNGFDEPPAG